MPSRGPDLKYDFQPWQQFAQKIKEEETTNIRDGVIETYLEDNSVIFSRDKHDQKEAMMSNRSTVAI